MSWAQWLMRLRILRQHFGWRDWRVEQKDVYTEEGFYIPGYNLNYRSTDFQQLGIVTDRYKVVQNMDALENFI